MVADMSDPLNSARAFLTAGNFNAAEKIVYDALENNADNMRAHVLLVEIAYGRGNHAKVLELTGRYAARWPDVVDFRVLRLNSIIAQDDADLIRPELARLKADFPYHRDLYLYYCGRAECVFGAIHRAQNYLDALRDNPANGDLVDALARQIALNKGDFVQSEGLIRKDMERHGGDPHRLFLLSISQFYNMDFAGARHSASAALEADSSNKQPLAVLWWVRWMAFPPFLFAQACELPGDSSGPAKGPLGRFFFGNFDVCMIALILVTLVLLAFLQNVLVFGFVIFMFGIAFAWPSLRWRILKHYEKQSSAPRDVSLKDF